MPVIEKSILINAPLEIVFAFMAEPVHWLGIWPSLVEIRNVQPLPNGGYCYDWTYKMAGVHLDGQAEWTEFVKNQRVVTRNEGGISNIFAWNFQEGDGGTLVTLRVEYTWPGAALAWVAGLTLDKINAHESETVLANLKVRMEG